MTCQQKKNHHKTGNNIGTEESCALSEALKVNTTLTKLSLKRVIKQDSKK